MTYNDLIEVRVNCEKAIKTLRESMESAEEAYVAEHFDNSIIGYPVSIKNEFYPRIACGGRYIITKVRPYAENLFDLTLIHVNEHNEVSCGSYTIYGIALNEIERIVG